MYRIPLENEQITKALTTPYAPVGYTDAEKEQFRENIGAGSGGADVTVTPIVTEGTNIADITVDGTTSHLYAPSGGGGGGIGRNLLDNPFFQVNQRNVSGSIENGGYVADRWKIVGTGASRDGNIVRLNTTSAYTYIRQNIEPDLKTDLVGKAVTLSFMLEDGQVYSHTFSSISDNAQNTYSMAILGAGYIDIDTRTPSNIKVLADGVNIGIVAVKIELGEQSTLANDTPPDYATELMKCQRYFYSCTQQKTGAVYLGCGGVFSNYAFVAIPVQMRVKPTATVIGSINHFVLNNGTTHRPTNVIVDGNDSVGCVMLGFAVSGVSNGQFVACYLNTGSSSDIWLSADL